MAPVVRNQYTSVAGTLNGVLPLYLVNKQRYCLKLFTHLRACWSWIRHLWHAMLGDILTPRQHACSRTNTDRSCEFYHVSDGVLLPGYVDLIMLAGKGATGSVISLGLIFKRVLLDKNARYI